MSPAETRVSEAPDSYAPFPEAGLSRLAASLADEAVYYRDRGDNREANHWASSADACRNALLSFAALRERMLLAETENKMLRVEKARLERFVNLADHELGHEYFMTLWRASDFQATALVEPAKQEKP